MHLYNLTSSSASAAALWETWTVPPTVLLENGESRRHGIDCDEMSVTFNDRGEVKKAGQQASERGKLGLWRFPALSLCVALGGDV